MKQLTESKEHYIKIIYQLIKQNGFARITDIAEELEVSKASTCRAVSELTELGLICRKDKHIYLTEMGTTTAKKIYQNFNLIKNYLVRCVGIDDKTALSVACALEHVLDYSQLDSLMQTQSA